MARAGSSRPGVRARPDQPVRGRDRCSGRVRRDDVVTGRGRATALVVLGTLLPTAVLADLGPGSVRAALRPGADVSDLLAGLAAVVGGLVVARLVLVAMAVLAARVPGRVGRLAGAVAARVTPVALRSVVRVALGAGVTLAPVVVPGAAAWAAAGPVPALAGLPVLDRAVSPAAAAGGGAEGPVVPVPGTAPATGSHVRTVVVVRPGDSLWAIAARHLPGRPTDAEIAQEWPRWYAANRGVIGPDPAVVRPGQHLVVPR
jgi:hypothetical protein